MNNLFEADYRRITGQKKVTFLNFLKYFFTIHQIRYLYFYRKKRNFIVKLILKRYKKKYGLEIYSDNVGEGLYIGHAFNITINKDAVLGKNCNIHKGVTIGQENRGARKGAPIIGDKVWIGVNATIVGHVTIGSNVLIAPNSYVNCDIPDDTVVFGNPCIIKSNSTATEGYIIL